MVAGNPAQSSLPAPMVGTDAGPKRPAGNGVIRRCHGVRCMGERILHAGRVTTGLSWGRGGWAA